jgi:hypothetical protein
MEEELYHVCIEVHFSNDPIKVYGSVFDTSGSPIENGGYEMLFFHF